MCGFSIKVIMLAYLITSVHSFWFLKKSIYRMTFNLLRNFFKARSSTLIEIFVPSRMLTSKRRRDKPWFNSELRKLTNKNKRALKQYRYAMTLRHIIK